MRDYTVRAYGPTAAVIRGRSPAGVVLTELSNPIISNFTSFDTDNKTGGYFYNGTQTQLNNNTA
jgi:hypothetical protein